MVQQWSSDDLSRRLLSTAWIRASPFPQAVRPAGLSRRPLLARQRVSLRTAGPTILRGLPKGPEGAGRPPGLGAGRRARAVTGRDGTGPSSWSYGCCQRARCAWVRRLGLGSKSLISTRLRAASAIRVQESNTACCHHDQGAIASVAGRLTVSQDCAPIRAPCGSAARSAATSAFTWVVVPALAKRYSICARSGVPGARSAAISAGATQTWAVWVIDVAVPTTVRRGEPGTPVTAICVPMPTGEAWPSEAWPSVSTTACPGCVAQRPECSVRSSTGPPGQARPTTVICCVGREEPDWPGRGDTSIVAVTVVSGNGPAAAVTSARPVVAASCAGEALAVAVTSAPCWAANARSNGALTSASGPGASAAAAVNTRTTR